MIVSNFKKISIGEKGVILKYQDKGSKEISFSEINKIYIKVKKVPVKYILLFVVLSLCIVMLLLWIYRFNLVVLSPSFLILAGVIKLNSYKRYVLKIKLRNGQSVIQTIPVEFKYKTIEDIKKVRKVLVGIV